MRKYKKYLVLFVLLALAVPSFAATLTRRPTGDHSSSGTWGSTGASYYTEVNEASANDSTNIYASTSPARNRFTFPAFSVPAGATVNNLTIHYRAMRNGNPGANIRSALLVGGTDYDTVDPGVNPSKTPNYADYSYAYATNPKTGAAWTVADINGAGGNPLQAFGVYTSDANPDVYVSQVYAVVDYTVPNSPPVGGYTADNVIPAAQCVQSTDGSGLITISFRVKDANLDPCTLKTFQYSVNGGGAWNPPTNGDVSGSLSSGWTNNGGSNYTSAADFSGPVYSFTFNTKHADVSGINGTDQNDIRIRFTVNDGAADSALPATSDNFSVDDLNPATLSAADITLRPEAGDTAVILDASFTEAHPNTNTFYLAVNGGAYGAGSAGDTNTADPSAHSTPAGATLDGNDYVSKVSCVHVDDFGNSGTNENLAPTSSGVKPYTPTAPTVSTPTASTVDVVVNKNASEATGLQYAIYVSSHTKYVQADGSLGDAAAWQTIAAWGTKTVTGLTAPVSNYVFNAKSRNPNGDNPESDLSGGASSANAAPVLHNGSAENVLVVPVQATDRSGDITIRFRIKDVDLDACSAVSGSFQYNVNGAGWNPILDADITGTKTGLASAVDLSGALHTLVWNNSKEYIDDAFSQNVQLRFQINDGSVNSTYGVSPLGFNIDNLDPAVATATDIYTQPLAGQASVTLNAAFTENNPNTNTFYLAVNGGSYGSATSGEANTATPTPQATAAGATLDGNDYVSKALCSAVDDFGNIGDNENLAPDAARKYAKPYTPSVPTVSNGTESTVDVNVNKYPDETPGLEYAIYVSSHAKYVQSDGTLGDAPAWQTIVNWGAKTVTGLNSPVSDYFFKTRSRNTSDAAHLASSQSDLSDAANTTGAQPTAEAVVSYSPAAGAEGVSQEAVVTVTFDRDMNTSSVQDVFSMNAVFSNTGVVVSVPVSGGFAWSGNRVLTFVPAANLSKGYSYRVTLAGNVKDYDGNDLALDLSWTFRVILDREIQNVFISADGRARVTLALGAMGNDAYVDINRHPVENPKEVIPSAILEANAKVLAKGDAFRYPFLTSITEINAYGTDDIRITQPFAAPVTVTFFYNDENNDGYVDNTNPRILEKGLWIYRLDEDHGLWVRVPQCTLNASQNYVSANVTHFSVYTLMATPFEDVSGAFAYPNPFKPSDGHTSVTFTDLGSVSTIKVFTLTGDLVKTIIENDGDGVATWNVKNEAGEDVASGLYYFVIRSGNDIKKGKLVIIR